MANKTGDLRVWWIPQIPGKPFYVPVSSLQDAGLIIDTLARYDQFQLDNHIKPDYSNVGGVQVFDEADTEYDGWSDWYSDDGDDFDTWWNDCQDAI